MQTTDFNLRKGYFAANIESDDGLVVVGKVEDIHEAVKKVKKIIRDSKGQINSVRMTIPYDVISFEMDAEVADAQLAFNEFDDEEFDSFVEEQSIGYAQLMIRSASGLFYFSFILKNKDPYLYGKSTALFTIPMYKLETEDVSELDHSYSENSMRTK